MRSVYWKAIRGGNGEIRVGSDDSVVIFLNGRRVHTQPAKRPDPRR